MLPLPLVLASGSPRRAQLLRDLGLAPRVVVSGASEAMLAGESPRQHVERVARAKAESAAGSLPSQTPPAIVLAADTVVVLEDAVLGKPATDEAALAMLLRLAGRQHEVLTGVWLLRTDDGRHSGAVVATRVRFRSFDGDRASWYVRSGEPRDKAGAYGIQGLGGLLTEGIEGSWSNVVGLPLETLPDLFASVGVDLFARLDSRRRDP